MNKKTNEPIKHHWIPQFILRNFADKNGYVNFHNKKTGKEEYLLPKEIFVYDNLYRDEKNNPDLPVEIEKNLASLEGDVAPIINKLLIGDEIVLSKAEEELLKVFVFVMNFRSKYSYNFFARRISEDSKIRYSEFQKDGDMESYWKRNLCQLAKCRTIEEIHNNANIDKYIKGFVWQDIDGFEGSYFMICRRKGNTDFVLSDVYPLLYEFENALFMKYEIYYLPVSPERVLILMKEFLGVYPETPIVPSKQYLLKPKEENGKLIYKVGKVFKKFVDFLNDISIIDAEEGHIYQEGNNNRMKK